MSHWYTQEGLPLYEVPKADGTGNRPTTLRDARKLNLVPSVTTIIATAAKPGLDIWKQNQLLSAAMELPRNRCKTDEEWCARVLKKSQEISTNSAKKGNDIHNALEEYFVTGKVIDGFEGYVVAVRDELDKNFGNQQWISEKSFSHELGFGGKVDLHNEFYIVDFKTKNTADFDKPLAYMEHAMQLAAYSVGLKLSTILSKITCANLFISTEQEGLVKTHIWTFEEMQKAWGMFTSLLTYWQLSNNHMVQDE